MDGNSLKAIELFGFMALAVWLVYYQLASSRRDRDPSRHNESRSSETVGHDDETPPR
jgi:hypothetical protein